MPNAWFGVSVAVGVVALSISSAPFEAQAPAPSTQSGARGGRDGAAGDQGGARQDAVGAAAAGLPRPGRRNRPRDGRTVVSI